jgi:hypothetical protein
MQRLKLTIVFVAVSAFALAAFVPSRLDLSAAAQGKKKPKPAAKPTPAKPAPTPAVTKPAPTPTPAMTKPAPTAMPTPAMPQPTPAPPMPPADPRPATTTMPSSSNPTAPAPSVKPPTATATPQPVVSNPPAAASGGPRKGPKPPDADIEGIETKDGKKLRYASTVQPTSPILFATDDPAKRTPANRAFDHAKHSLEKSYSEDGARVTGCAECHHTDQPSSSLGYLKLFERSETLTAGNLSKAPVSSCRVCHWSTREGSLDPPLEAPSGTTYPPEAITGYAADVAKEVDGYGYASQALNSEIAYHINCVVCHGRAKKSRPTLQLPTKPTECTFCHTK